MKKAIHKLSYFHKAPQVLGYVSKMKTACGYAWSDQAVHGWRSVTCKKCLQKREVD